MKGALDFFFLTAHTAHEKPLLYMAPDLLFIYCSLGPPAFHPVATVSFWSVWSQKELDGKPLALPHHCKQIWFSKAQTDVLDSKLGKKKNKSTLCCSERPQSCHTPTCSAQVECKWKLFFPLTFHWPTLLEVWVPKRQNVEPAASEELLFWFYFIKGYS